MRNNLSMPRHVARANKKVYLTYDEHVDPFAAVNCINCNTKNMNRLNKSIVETGPVVVHWYNSGRVDVP